MEINTKREEGKVNNTINFVDGKAKKYQMRDN